MFLKKYAPWLVFFIFVATTLYFKHPEPLFVSSSPLPLGKSLAWLAFFCFLGYTMYCSAKADFFDSIPQLYPIIWSRQITLDLYMGLGIFVFLMYLHEGSVWVVLYWLLPLLAFVNLATLLYLAMNYDAIVAHFLH